MGSKNKPKIRIKVKDKTVPLKIKPKRGGRRDNQTGRPTNPATTRTAEIANQQAASGLQMPLEYMLDLMRTGPEELKEKFDAGELDHEQYIVALMELNKRRDWAAQQAAPYCHAKLANIQNNVTLNPHESWLALLPPKS